MASNSAWKLILLAAAGVVELSSSSTRALEQGRIKDELGESTLPLVVNTWAGVFSGATQRAWETVSTEKTEKSTALDAVEKGCNFCEDKRCGGSVGYGGHPDSSGEVTLDSMVMDGPRHAVGAVGCLRRIRNAATVARAVMEHTEHTMLAGEGATAFARMLGMQEEDLSTDASRSAHQSWESANCQPNYYREIDGAGDSCPPYPAPERFELSTAGNKGAVFYGEDRESITGSGRRGQREWRSDDPARLQISDTNHDTIGMVIVDARGDVACGTTTNGAANKVAGRVGDSPIAGAGCYVDNDIGGAAATGDGDVMMRFLPSYRAVENMRAGASPQDACVEALCRIARFYPTYGGALVCANTAGKHGAARHGLSFSYSYYGPGHEGPQVAHAIEADDQVCQSIGEVLSQG